MCLRIFLSNYSACLKTLSRAPRTPEFWGHHFFVNFDFGALSSRRQARVVRETGGHEAWRAAGDEGGDPYTLHPKPYILST